ncbi:hypothetical protein PIN17_0088 [Prevotella intermedia 17]|nr:hypothetical protein PIN17_0088 [Prevotella intermedia 17]
MSPYALLVVMVMTLSAIVLNATHTSIEKKSSSLLIMLIN